MPHITIEYSAGADTIIPIDALVRAVHRTARESGHFAPNVVRTLARAADHSLVADEDPGNHFVQINVRMAPGRTSDVRKAFAHSIFTAASGCTPGAWERGRFALRVDISESDPDVACHRNTLPA